MLEGGKNPHCSGVRLRLALQLPLFWSRTVFLGENPKEFTEQILGDIERGSINWKIRQRSKRI